MIYKNDTVLQPLYPPCHSMLLLVSVSLTLTPYNDIFGYFAAILLYREFRYNDTSIQRYNFTAPLTYRYIGVPLYKVISLHSSERQQKPLNTINMFFEKQFQYLYR